MLVRWLALLPQSTEVFGLGVCVFHVRVWACQSTSSILAQDTEPTVTPMHQCEGALV